LFVFGLHGYPKVTASSISRLRDRIESRRVDRAALSRELEALLAGEEGAKLVAYFKRLRVNADDCLQETIARALAAADRYDPTRAKLAAWLWGFANKIALERRRGVSKDRKRLGFLGSFVASTEPEAGDPAPEEPLDQDEKKALVRKAVAALPEELRVVIELSVFGGLTQEQIAEALELTERGVQHRMSQAREALAESLRKLGF
jgi:RNA polymerase sigma factor (sigma-70 family)